MGFRLLVQREHHIANGHLVQENHAFLELGKRLPSDRWAFSTTPQVTLMTDRDDSELVFAATRATNERRVYEISFAESIESRRLGAFALGAAEANRDRPLRWLVCLANFKGHLAVGAEEL